MGRGRAKAKQTKVARRLKYDTGGTDLDALRAEIVGDPPSGADESAAGHSDTDGESAGDTGGESGSYTGSNTGRDTGSDDEYADLYAKYLDEDDEHAGQRD